MHQSWGSQDSWNKKQTTQSAELLRKTGMRTSLQGGRQRTFPLSLIRDSDRDGVGVRKRQQRQVAAKEEAYNRVYTVGTGRESQEWVPGDHQTISFHCCFLIRKAERKACSLPVYMAPFFIMLCCSLLIPFSTNSLLQPSSISVGKSGFSQIQPLIPLLIR